MDHERPRQQRERRANPNRGRGIESYGEVEVLLLDLAAKRAWYKIILSHSERVLVQNQLFNKLQCQTA